MYGTAAYDAECWSEGKSEDEIKSEISRLESMWTLKIAHPFPKSAHYAYGRILTLQKILTNELLFS